MNDPFESLTPSDITDPDDSGGDDVIFRMEERLMRCRPRSPKLDIEAIEKIADNEATSRRIIALGLERSTKFSSPQLAGTIAASWLCGVVVGATCILLTTSSQVQPTQNFDPIVTTKNNQSEVPESIASENKQTANSTASVNKLWQLDLDTEALRAGMSLPSRGMLVRAMDDSSDILVGRHRIGSVNPKTLTDDESGSLPDSNDSIYTPTKPMTSSELMKELSGDIGFRIH